MAGRGGGGGGPRNPNGGGNQSPKISVLIFPKPGSQVLTKRADGKFDIVFELKLSKTPNDPVQVVVTVQGQRVNMATMSVGQDISIGGFKMDDTRDCDIKAQIFGTNESDTYVIPKEQFAEQKPAPKPKAVKRLEVKVTYNSASNQNSINLVTRDETGKYERGDVSMVVGQGCTVYKNGRPQTYHKNKPANLNTKSPIPGGTDGISNFLVELNEKNITGEFTHLQSGEIVRTSLLYTAPAPTGATGTP